MIEKIKKILCYLTLMLFFVCCGQNKDTEVRYSDVVLHDEGKKFVFRTFSDSLDIEHVKIFSTQENLDLKYRLFKDLKNGFEYGYYDSGNLKYKAYFINDTLQGESKWYFDNKAKTVKNIYNYIDGVVAGNQIVFNENGIKKKYLSNTYDEQLKYVADYDDNGNLIKEDGIYKTFGEFNSIDFRTDNSIIYRGFFSTPNHIEIDYRYSLSKLGEDDIWKKKVLLNSKIMIDTIISSPGKYIFKEKISISKNKDSIVTELYEFPLEVIK